MYLFGGSNQQKRDHHHTFWLLDLKTLRWDIIQARGDVPINREDHTAVIYEGAIVVFGGFLPNGEKTNDIYMYYFKENKWEKVSVLGLDLPKSRAGHSAIVFGDSMVIFGGRDEDSNKMNDIWVFNFTSY
jgi:N-acetylneuraminic acid mutarotase